MFSREELITKDIAELVDIARSYNIDPETISSTEEAADRIIAAQEQGMEPVKRTRRRVLKKDTTDHVYSVTGIEGSKLDTKIAKRKMKSTDDAVPEAPKKRGRPRKKPLEESVAEETLTAEQEPSYGEQYDANTLYNNNDNLFNNEENDVYASENTYEENIKQNTGFSSQYGHENANDDIATYSEEENNEEGLSRNGFDESYHHEEGGTETDEPFNIEGETSKNIIARLQAKMNSQNKPDEYHSEMADENNVWQEDPADGTDFIIVKDLPIEDAGAMASVDIFDNPTTIQLSGKTEKTEPAGKKYDFNKIITTIGLLEVMVENYGFLRSSDYNYLSSPDDVYVPMQIIRKFALKTGDVVECFVAPPSSNDKYFTLIEIKKINGRNPDDIHDRIPFEHLTPLFPNEKFNLCANKTTTNLSTRIVDLFAPIGKGQRALLVAQPKTGKTILMKDIANAIASSHPEAYLMMLLIDERPEEVTDMMRTVKAEVVASTFDEPAERHVKIAGLVLEKAKRMVECGHDVVIFLDSITRLARAYNTVAPASGKVLTGGVDANALQKPKRFFGAARNIENGGSLTIIATALIDTGSKMDEVIFEEFKGTGNMELQLDRALANKRLFPAVNLVASSTRRDDLLHDKMTLDRMWVLRKIISDMNPIEAMTEIRDRMSRTRDNEEFLLTLND